MKRIAWEINDRSAITNDIVSIMQKAALCSQGKEIQKQVFFII